MKRRQTPRQWLALDRDEQSAWRTVRRLPPGTGVLLLCRDLSKRERSVMLAKLRRIAATRGLTISDEAEGGGARVHNMRELRRANLAKIPLIFLSPVFPTASHPDWRPLPRMRAAAMIRLAKAPVIALGGMSERRFWLVKALGFQGWAGIGAWARSRSKRSS
jgi:thiamine-phosphate pyrophosphorylase